MFKTSAYFVFCFLLKLLWPTHKSIIQVISRRYGHETLLKFSNLEKLRKKRDKILLDIDFLENCLKNDVIPKFLYFKLANNRLRSSKTYREIQLKLLRSEINYHKTELRNVNCELSIITLQFKQTLPWYDYLYVNGKLADICNKEIKTIKKRQRKKLNKLLQSRKSTQSFDPDKLIYNFSNRVLSKDQISALVKGLKYGIPPSKSNENEIFTTFEISYHSLKDLPINEKVFTNERFKHKYAECAYSYCRQYKSKSEQNLTENEWKGLLELKQDPDIVILKADKGNCTVLLRRDDYVHELENMLGDESKFRLLTEDPTLKREEKLIRHLLSLKRQNSISESFYDKL